MIVPCDVIMPSQIWMRHSWLNKCFVYNEDVLSYVLMVQWPLICQKIKANLISHVMTPLRGDVAGNNKKNSFYMHLTIFRFWAFWFFRLVERKHPKEIDKCLFYSTLSICVNRLRFQYIFLKAVFSKLVFLSS